MVEALKIVLPESSDEDRKKLVGCVGKMKEIDGVAGAGTTQVRAIDPVSIGVWIKLIVEAAGAAGLVVGVVTKIVEMIRGKGIKGAEIQLPNEVVIKVDEASSKDIEDLIVAARGKN